MSNTTEHGGRSLRELLDAVGAAARDGAHEGVHVRGIEPDSRAVSPGDLYVAIPGHERDGHDFVGEAVARGAVAVLVERDPGDIGIPVLSVPDARRALAEIASVWFGHPAERLRLVGITGTVGKTTVLAMLDAIFVAAKWAAGAVGSNAVGVRMTGRRVEPSERTTPDPLTLHRVLREMADAGTTTIGLEITSQALAQRRTHGLRLALGVFTTLIPFEHKEYHGTFRAYAGAKRRFFDHLLPDAPVVLPAGDMAARALARSARAKSVLCGGPRRDVQVKILAMRPEGTSIRIAPRSGLIRLDGTVVDPVEMEIDLRLLGHHVVRLAGLAATAGLLLGVAPAAIRTGLEALEPPWRRMELLHRGRFTIVDDSAGHPESLNAMFRVVQRLPHARIRIAFAVRGARGADVNRRDAQVLAFWAARTRVAGLYVSDAQEATAPADRVTREEADAFRDGLHGVAVPVRWFSRLEDAVRSSLEAAEPGDMVLLLGAQGMDQGREIACAWVEENPGLA